QDKAQLLSLLRQDPPQILTGSLLLVPLFLQPMELLLLLLPGMQHPSQHLQQKELTNSSSLMLPEITLLLQRQP
ncbi:MAG TPA: hypothetical protein VD927_18540, partial [Chryseosolibacter sp.]|nr:hypothetical protein [Chryseosolibacter sp.]